MKTAELRPIGMLKQYSGGRECIQVPSGIPLREALSACGIPPDLVAIAFMDQKPVNKDQIIQPGDTIDLHAVIGGG
jgi:sulfur carrier protein ThiS